MPPKNNRARFRLPQATLCNQAFPPVSDIPSPSLTPSSRSTTHISMAPPSLPDLESPRPSSSGTMAPPPLPHIKSHLLAGHAEVVLVATGRAEPISSSPPPGGSAIAQPAAQPPITPVVGAGVHDASGDPLHHTTLLTPLPSILPKGHS